jgi:hypothetical protein
MLSPPILLALVKTAEEKYASIGQSARILQMPAATWLFGAGPAAVRDRQTRERRTGTEMS